MYALSLGSEPKEGEVHKGTGTHEENACQHRQPCTSLGITTYGVVGRTVELAPV